MARTNPAAESWGAFMRSRMAALKLNQAEFRRRMAAAGSDISKQTASQWANGDNAPDANTVLAVAQVLEARDTDALRAAGFDPVADRLEKQNPESDGTPRGEPVDPVVEYIMGMTELSMKFRRTLVDEYLEDQATIKRRARNAAERSRELASRADEEGDDEAGRVA